LFVCLFVCFFIAEADGRKCHYPSWFLAHNRWQTLDGRWTYALHKNSTMRIINNTTSGHATLSSAAIIGGGGLSFGSAAGSASVDSRMEQKAACQSVLDLGDGAARVVAHLSQGWCVCHVFLFHPLPSLLSPSILKPPSGLALCIEVKDRKTVGSSSLSSLPTEVGGGRIFFFFCRNGSKNREPSAFIASRSHADERSNKGFFFYYYFFRVPESLS
jgi:hypothetical protein